MSSNTFLENYYNEYDEDGRLASNRIGIVEYLTTRRYLDPLLTGSKSKSTLDFYKRAGYNCTDKTAFVQWL